VFVDRGEGEGEGEGDVVGIEQENERGEAARIIGATLDRTSRVLDDLSMVYD